MEKFKEFEIKSYDELKQYIKNYCIKNDGRTNGFAIKAQIDIIKQYIPNCLGQNYSEYAYWLLNDIKEYPECVICGNEVTSFYGIKNGYSQTCTQKCGSALAHKNVSIETKVNMGIKISETLLSKTQDEWDKIKEKRAKTNLKKYGVESSNSHPDVKEKTKQTNILRYGGPAPLSSDKIKEKVKQTCLERYGVENVLQSEDVKDKINKTNLKRYGTKWHTQSDNFKEKAKKTWMIKYGFDNPSKDQDIKDAKRATTFANYGVECGFFLNRSSKSHSTKSDLYFDELYDSLHEDDQDCTYSAFLNETEFNIYDTKTRRSYYYDFVCTSLKICIEFQGDYWHMNPKQYEPNDYNMNTQLTAQEHWYNDQYKKELIEAMGYTVYYVWESDV